MGSAVQTQQPANKVPGGRKVTARNDERTIEARREKNRQAQHLFRKRRQAADAVTGQRIKQLEAVINEMSCSMVALVDDILAIEALATQYPSIVTSLHQCLARVLTLSRDAECMDFDSTTAPQHSEDSSPSSDRSSEIKDMNTHSVQHQPDLSIAQNPLDNTTSVNRSLGKDFLRTPITTAAQQPRPSSLPLVSDTFVHSRSVLTPQSFTAGLYPVPNIPQTVHSFPFQLAEMSLTYGLTLITTAPLGAIQREFGMSLSYRRREDIVASLQWALGSGRQYVHDFIYNSAKSVVQGDGNSEVFLLKGPMERESSSQKNSEFLTVIDVYALLRGLNARNVSTDVMEIQFTNRIMSAKNPPSGSGTGSGRSSLSSAPLPSEPVTKKMKLNVPILMSRLVHIGVCFETGPGYPREEVLKAIEASETMV